MLAELLEAPLVFLYVLFGCCVSLLLACLLTLIVTAPIHLYEWVLDRLEGR